MCDIILLVWGKQVDWLRQLTIQHVNHLDSFSGNIHGVNEVTVSRLLIQEGNKTRVLLCKRLSGQCRDAYMVVYFHLHWCWWAVLGCTGLYWTVLVFTKLNWAVVGCSRLYCGVLGFSGRSQQLFVCVFSHFQHGNERTTEQPTRWSKCKPALDQCKKAVFCNYIRPTTLKELEQDHCIMYFKHFSSTDMCFKGLQ